MRNNHTVYIYIYVFNLNTILKSIMHFVKAESETFEELPLFHAFKSRFIIELNVLNMNDSYSFLFFIL